MRASMARALTVGFFGFTTYLATYLAAGGLAWAGTIEAQGNVVALDNINQIGSVTGSAMFDEEFQGPIPLDQYAGITFQVGELGMILPGVVEVGEAPEPQYTAPGVYFPTPIAGFGAQTGNICLTGGAITFADPVTQFGLTAAGLVTMHITAWDSNGALIGQVTWTPDENQSAFVGIDTMGVPIALLAISGDDIFGGVEWDDLGATPRSDNWIWGLGDPCQSEDDCFEDTWSCTARACTDGACVYNHTTEPCDDANLCTEMDACSEGLCGGSPVNCSDTSVCTFDSCDPVMGCTNAPIDGCCFTDEDCPDGFMCLISSNTCVEGPPPPPPPPPEETETGDGDGDADTGETTGSAAEDGGGGCGCSTPERGGGALLGLFALVALCGLRRRDD